MEESCREWTVDRLVSAEARVRSIAEDLSDSRPCLEVLRSISELVTLFSEIERRVARDHIAVCVAGLIDRNGTDEISAGIDEVLLVLGRLRLFSR